MMRLGVAGWVPSGYHSERSQQAAIIQPNAEPAMASKRHRAGRSWRRGAPFPEGWFLQQELTSFPSLPPRG